MKKKKEKIEDYLFVGALFVGLGLGIYFEQVAVGVLIGLGVGFLLRAIYYLLKKKK